MLEGIRVIDFTQLLPGPYATMRLSDLGAQVIKVEPPTGDPARRLGEGGVFLANNRNKQSICLDLKSPKGFDAVCKLIDGADVMIEGFRPGVAKRLGIGWEAVSKRNPQLVYCSLTGYGQTGNLHGLAGHDINYLAMSGVLDQMRDGDGRPIVPSLQWGDLVGGIVASEAILAALVARAQSDRGRYLDISMTDALSGLLSNHFLMQALWGLPHGVPELTGHVLCYHLYQTRDGAWMALGALEPKFWEAFCRAVNHSEWIFAQFTKDDHDNPVYTALVQCFRQKDEEYWTRLGVEADCCLTPVLRLSEAADGQGAADRRRFQDVTTTHWGTLRQVATHAGGFPPHDPLMRSEPPVCKGQEM